MRLSKALVILPLVILLLISLLLSACLPQAAPTAQVENTGTPQITTPTTPAPTPTDQAVKPATWWKDAIVYEVFVRSFYDSDGSGAGDFNGLTQKLDYLKDGKPGSKTSLGVNTLWLMPVFPTRSYHGYDVVQYDATNPEYGSLDDFKTLLAEAHRRGINIIIDLPINHTSVEHPWFKASAARDPQYADYYIWSDTDPHYTGPWGETVWHPFGERYYYGVFDKSMPDLNYRNPAVTQAIYQVADFWLKEVGVDGFRLDGTKHLIEKDRVQENTQETRAWLKAFYAHIKAVKPEALVVGEVWSPLADIAPYVNEGGLDLAFNFPLAEALLSGLTGRSADKINALLVSSQASIKDNRYGAFLSNHDQTRVMTRLGDNPDRAKAAAAVLLTAPGVPFIYYGEEIGMLGDKPDPRLRTPMQWSAEKNAGFTTGAPWEPAQDDYPRKNVAAQDQDPASLLNHYRQLLQIRAAHEALRTGAFVAAKASSNQVFAALRVAEKERILILINLTNDSIAAPSFTWASSSLKGTYQPRLLYGAGQIAPLTVDNQGGVTGYQPVKDLPVNSILIIQYEP